MTLRASIHSIYTWAIYKKGITYQVTNTKTTNSEMNTLKGSSSTHIEKRVKLVIPVFNHASIE